MMRKTDILCHNDRRKGVFMKRIFSMLLACILLLQAVPLTGFAAEQDIAPTGIEEQDGIYYIQTFEDLKELASRTYDEAVCVQVDGVSTFTISESLTLPAQIWFDVPNTEVIIPAGVTFRAGSSSWIGKLTVHGTGYFNYLQIRHTLTVTGKLHTTLIELFDEAASLNREFTDVVVGADNIDGGLWICPTVSTAAELQTCVQKANALPSSSYVYGVSLSGGDFVIDRSITIPTNMHLCAIPSRGANSVAIASGCTLTLNYIFEIQSPLTVEGTLVNNGGISITTGTSYASGSMTIAPGGRYSGEGSIQVSGSAEYKNVLTGINLDNYDITTRADGAVLRFKTDTPKVTATNVASTGKIKLTWNKVSSAKEYQVYRATSKNGEYKLMKTTTGTSYTNTSATAGKTYYYKVRAVTKNGKKLPFSDVVSRCCDLSRPEVKTSNVSSSGKIKLTWDKISGAEKYEIYRATSEDGEYKLVKTTTGTSYTNTSAKAGTKYYYKVKAIHSKSSADSAFSEAESRFCDLARPVVTIKLKSGDPRLTWEAVDGAVEYQIYRATSKSGTYKLMKTTTGTSYTNTSAKAGKTYYYKVKAIHSNSSSNSAYSSVVSIKAK